MSEVQKTEIFQVERNDIGKSDISGKPNGRKRGILAVIVVILIVLIVGSTIYNAPANRLSRQLDLGQRYLEEQNYEQAIVEFNKAIEIDPMSVEAYLGLSDVYIEMNDYEAAAEVLQRGYNLTNGEVLKQKYDIVVDDIKSSGNIDTNFADVSYDDKDEEEIKFAQKLEQLTALFEQGRSDNIFQLEELNFFGHSVNNMTKEVFLSNLAENGYIQTGTSKEELEHCSADYFPNGQSQEAPSIWGSNNNYSKDEYFDYWIFTTYTETEEHMPIGVRDIYTYDTLEDVLTTFGFSNGKEISDFINEAFTTENRSVDIFYSDIGRPVFTVFLERDDNGMFFTFDFTNVDDDHGQAQFDYINGTFRKLEEDGNVTEDVFDGFVLKFYYPEGSLNFCFNQYEGSFLYLNKFAVMLSDD